MDARCRLAHVIDAPHLHQRHAVPVGRADAVFIRRRQRIAGFIGFERALVAAHQVVAQPQMIPAVPVLRVDAQPHLEIRRSFLILPQIHIRMTAMTVQQGHERVIGQPDGVRLQRLAEKHLSA